MHRVGPDKRATALARLRQLDYRSVMGRLYFASLVTLTLLFGMIAGVVIAALVAVGSLDVAPALALTAAINLILFVVSPWITDLMLRWINGVVFLDDTDLATKHPHVHALIHDVARDYGFKAPAVGIIPDRNPTAFTYGLFRSNARVVLTDGIFEFLSEDETRAVVGHELGHIVNRDFVVMTVAGMMVQMLYVIYSGLTRTKSDSKGKNNAFVVGVAAYVLYVLGTYVLLYLSRTREYLADSFSAERVEARHLANALVKIAYGISEAADTEKTRDLLASTRHLGVVDYKGVAGLAFAGQEAKSNPDAAADAMLFDIYNPWAKFIELNSTHPLTGKRINALATIASAKQQAFQDIDVVAAAKRANVSRSALWGKFLRELCIIALPFIAMIVVGVAGALSPIPALAVLAVPALAFGFLALVPLTYPFSTPKSTSVASLMGDVAASPVIGIPVRLDGQVIGRVAPGNMFGEDTIFADRSGRVAIDFRSLLGKLGDIWTGWRRIKRHIGESGQVTGWFRRSMGGYVILSRLSTPAGTIRAYPYLGGLFTAFIVFAIVAALVLFVPQMAGK